jgi:hypothetical protein
MPPMTPRALAEIDRRFTDERAAALAGRCLLDGIEFLSTKREPLYNEVVVYSHAIRLCWQCAADLDDRNTLEHLKKPIDAAVTFIRDSRKAKAPFFGDDFWDWSYVLEALLIARRKAGVGLTEDEVGRELEIFYRELANRLRSASGPFELSAGEWYGPAIPAAIHRLLGLAVADYGINFPVLEGLSVETCKKQLKALAIEPVRDGKYRAKAVVPSYVHWHLGQVAAQFPTEFAAQGGESSDTLEDLSDVRSDGQPDQAYALARIIQASSSIDEATKEDALKLLYASELQGRSFGHGLIGQSVKASLNVLDGLWPTLNAADRNEIGRMLKAFFAPPPAPAAPAPAATPAPAPAATPAPAPAAPAPAAPAPPAPAPPPRSVWKIPVALGVIAVVGLILVFVGPPSCMDGCGSGRQRMDLSAGRSACVSHSVAELLVCLDGASLTEASSSLKKTLTEKAELTEGELELNVELEAAAVRDVVTKHRPEAGDKALELCGRAYAQAAGIPFAVSAPPSLSDTSERHTTTMMMGYVLDETTKGGVPGVSVEIVDTLERATTDSEGRFLLPTSRQGTVKLRLKHGAYETLDRNVNVSPKSDDYLIKPPVRPGGPKGPVCFAVHRDKPIGCSVYCDKGPQNNLKSQLVKTVHSSVDCAVEAAKVCKGLGAGVSCTYAYVSEKDAAQPTPSANP